MKLFARMVYSSIGGANVGLLLDNKIIPAMNQQRIEASIKKNGFWSTIGAGLTATEPMWNQSILPCAAVGGLAGWGYDSARLVIGRQGSLCLAVCFYLAVISLYSNQMLLNLDCETPTKKP